MHIVFVNVCVKPEAVDQFTEATIQNASNSIKEPGVIRFDFFRQVDETNRFTLVEIYKSPEDQLKHRETDHYNKWRLTVADMMAEPRQGVRYINIYPVETDRFRS